MTDVIVKFPFCKVDDIEALIDDVTVCYNTLKYKQLRLKDEFISIHFISEYKENFNSLYYYFKNKFKKYDVKNFSIDVLECR